MFYYNYINNNNEIFDTMNNKSHNINTWILHANVFNKDKFGCNRKLERIIYLKNS